MQQHNWYDSSIGRFINEDTYEGELNNPLSLNLYTYVHNNPLKYVDPTGHWIDAVIDAGFIIYDIGKIIVNPADPTNWYALGADVVGLVTPGGTGFGMAVRAGDKASDIAKGLSKLSKQERIDAVGNGQLIMSYKELKKVTKGTGLEAHHLIEKRFADTLGIKEKDMLSIALDKDTHAKITEMYRKYLPYNGTKGANVTTRNATPEQIWEATEKVYTEMNMTQYLDLLRPYFENIKK